MAKNSTGTTPHQILLYLSSLSLSVRAEGEKLYVSPQGKITEEARKVIKANKAKLLRYLAGEQAQADRAYLDPPDFSTSPVAERESLLVSIGGLTIAWEPAHWEEAVRQVAEWNAAARERARARGQAGESQERKRKEPSQRGIRFDG